MTYSSHPLFPRIGYTVQALTDTLFLETQCKKNPSLPAKTPKVGQHLPQLGVFYIAPLHSELKYAVLRHNVERNTIEEVVDTIKYKSIAKKIQDATAKPAFIELIQEKNILGLDDLIKHIDEIWKITAERDHTYSEPAYYENRNIFLSDHLPIGHDDIISWNITGKGAIDGAFHYHEHLDTWHELITRFDNGGLKKLSYEWLTDNSAAHERYARIAQSLTRMVRAQKANIIILQEADDIQIVLKEALARELKQTWFTAWTRGCLIAFNTAKYSLIEGSIEKTTYNEFDRYLKISLQALDQGSSPIDCYCLWTGFDHFPEKHEQVYQEKILAAQAKGHRLVAGCDTNTRSYLSYGEEEQHEQNIATGIIPWNFIYKDELTQRDRSLQHIDFPDIIFTFNKEQGVEVFSQVLDPYTGLKHIRHNKEDIEQYPEIVKEMLKSSYKACMLLSDKHKNTAQDYLNLEKKITRITGASILIRPAVNGMNQPGISILIKDKNHFFIQGVMAELEKLSGKKPKCFDYYSAAAQEYRLISDSARNDISLAIRRALSGCEYRLNILAEIDGKINYYQGPRSFANALKDSGHKLFALRNIKSNMENKDIPPKFQTIEEIDNEIGTLGKQLLGKNKKSAKPISKILAGKVSFFPSDKKSTVDKKPEVIIALKSE